MNHRRLLPLITLLAPAVLCAQASPYYAGIAQSLSHDSNLYRLADGVPAPFGLARSDRIATTTLLAGVRQQLGRQALRGDVSLRAGRFGNNQSLDNEGHRIALGLDWATVERLSGSVSLSRDRSLVRFDSDSALSGPGALQRNLSTATRLEALARIGLVTRWSGELRANYQQADYSAAAYRSRELREHGASAGLRYSFSDALEVGAALRATEGRYPRFAQAADGRFVEDRYQGRFVDLNARWVPSALSQLDARVSLGSTNFDRATASDLSGLTGSATWIWRPSAKLRWETRLARDRGQDASALLFPGSGRFADFSRTTASLSAGVSYEWSTKLRLSAGLGHARRGLADTRQDLLGQTRVRNGDDRTTFAAVGLRWLPWRSVTLGCDLGREQRRHQGELSTDYRASTFGCFGQFILQ